MQRINGFDGKAVLPGSTASSRAVGMALVFVGWAVMSDSELNQELRYDRVSWCRPVPELACNMAMLRPWALGKQPQRANCPGKP